MNSSQLHRRILVPLDGSEIVERTIPDAEMFALAIAQYACFVWCVQA